MLIAALGRLCRTRNLANGRLRTAFSGLPNPARLLYRGNRTVGYRVLHIVCLDLEGVLTPEIWIAMAERTGIDALRATTRDIPDYDVLMRQRLDILNSQGLRIGDVTAVIGEMAPLPGARAFLDNLRERYQVLILSDTYYEFADPLMAALGRPTLLCNRLEIAPDGRIADYHLRFKDHKRATVSAMQDLGFKVLAAGDSFNDTGMLDQAEFGVLFRAPDSIAAAFPQHPTTSEFDRLAALFDEAAARLN